MNELFTELREKLLRRFRGVFNFEDVVNEALLRTHQRLCAANDIGNIEAFAIGVARKIILENSRGMQVSFQAADLDSFITSTMPEPDPELSMAELKELARTALCASERKLFYQYYSGVDRKRMAANLNISVGHLYVKIHRFRERLIAEKLRMERKRN